MAVGMEISDIDLLNVYTFAERVISLAEYRVSLQNYLHTKMGLVAPNLQSLIGDQVGKLPQALTCLAETEAEHERE